MTESFWGMAKIIGGIVAYILVGYVIVYIIEAIYGETVDTDDEPLLVLGWGLILITSCIGCILSWIAKRIATILIAVIMSIKAYFEVKHGKVETDDTQSK